MGKFSLILLTIGIPGSGKTTWVNEYKKAHPLTYVISSDEIRKELYGSYKCDPEQSQRVHDVAREKAKAILEDPNSFGGLGPEIIIDSTNTDVEEWLKFKKLGASVLLAKVFDRDPFSAFKATEMRDDNARHVPLDVIRSKHAELQLNKKFLPLIFNLVL